MVDPDQVQARQPWQTMMKSTVRNGRLGWLRC